MIVRNLDQRTVIADRVTLAGTSKERRIGLLRHERMEPGEGLWIVPCEAVHTFRMKFPIDVVYLSRAKRVLKIRTNMARSRMSFCLTAHSALELAAGGAAGIKIGDQLAFETLPQPLPSVRV